MLHKIFLLIISISVLSGCVVSKKKYEALLSEKNRVDNDLKDKISENNKLNSDLKSAVADYETVRYKLSRSNAIKSDDVSDLMIQATALQSKVDELNKQLADIKNDFKYNRQNALKTVEELKKAKQKLLDLQRDTASLHYSISLAKERNESVSKELSEVNKKYNNLYSDLSNSKEELNKKDIQLRSLEDQLMEQKDKMEAISKAFISLRKELLSAQSSNKPIDPNMNASIDKIARLLGHY